MNPRYEINCALDSVWEEFYPRFEAAGLLDFVEKLQEVPVEEAEALLRTNSHPVWKEFLDAMDAQIVNDPYLDASEKFYSLTSAGKGETEEAMQAMYDMLRTAPPWIVDEVDGLAEALEKLPAPVKFERRDPSDFTGRNQRQKSFIFEFDEKVIDENMGGSLSAHGAKKMR